MARRLKMGGIPGTRTDIDEVGKLRQSCVMAKLARLLEQCHAGGGATRPARTRPYQIPLGQRNLCGASGANGRSQAPSWKTRPG